MKQYLVLISILFYSAITYSQTFIDWSKLKNPVYEKYDWSVKDACVYFKENDSTFYLFFSAFFFDNESNRERSHIVSLTTKDWLIYSEPLFIWDGEDSGWYGVCSPEIHFIEDKYILTYNRWGDKEGLFNQLYYAVSDDLINWTKDIPLAHNLTNDFRAIDAALAYFDSTYYLFFKESKPLGNKKRVDLTRLAYSNNLDSSWSYVYSGYPVFTPEDKSFSCKTHENYRLLQIDGIWYNQMTDYFPHKPFLYKLQGNPYEKGNWLVWDNGYELNIPIEDFNTDHSANAGHLIDWRAYDGYFYLLYAGNTENKTHWGRGNNKLGLARSKDLVNWEVP